MTNVLSYLEKSAQCFPDKIAFADANSEISFSQLKDRAMSVATHLIKYVTPRKPVVLLMEKSTLTMTGFMGAVYAGCFYVLIDPRHPVQRIQTIINTLDAKVLLVDSARQKQAEKLGFEGDVLLLEDLQDTPADLEALDKIRASMLDIDPLYAIFTSGSTGVPKGVVVSHRSTIDFIDVFTKTFAIDENDVIGNQAPFDFDVSVKDIYSGLKTGARVEIIPRGYFSFPTKLMDFLVDREVTTLIWAVSALCFITTMNGLEYKLPEKLKKIMFSGEVMPIKHLNKWRSFVPNAMYVNLYGPTEITCNCTYYILDRDFAENEVLPLGVPFENERVFLLDENDNEVTQPEVLGELCVSGTALSMGYYNNWEKTNQAFVQNPLNKCFIEPIYRTGDLAKYDADGNMYYVTRKDYQIKHMGHRIELSEIEIAINAVEGVNRVCCIYFEDKQRIVAFYDGTADKKDISKAIKQVLPVFMIPNAFEHLETLPMTKNGKIDRGLLKANYAENN